MPLYVDDETILAKFTNLDVVYGLRFIKAAVAVRAVTPALAQQLIRCYLRPLASVEGQMVFDRKRKVSWDSLHFLYVDLGFCSKDDEDLWQVACAVDLVYAHTKRPPRELVFAPIEVNTFIQHAGYLHLRMEDVRYPEGPEYIDPLCFCELCWRQPLPGRRLCGHHAPSDPMQSETAVRSAAARYKAGVRQKELLEKTVNQILTRETIKFHESGFQDPLLLPTEGIASWLAERRPCVWRELGHEQDRLSDENAVQILLDFLHNLEGLPAQATSLYQTVNAHIRAHPALIWPMLIRAEGWYQSRELMENNRGGSRFGAGRPKRTKK